MALVQQNSLAGENQAHFIQFLMMHQQQALLALGAHPNPPPGVPPPNLPLGKAFLDQLGAIEERTRGHLVAEEESVLKSVLATLRAAYLQRTGA